MTIFYYWVNIQMDISHTGISIPERVVGKIISVPVADVHELSQDELIARALQKWIACYDTQCYCDPRRTDKLPGDLTLTNIRLMGIQMTTEESDCNSLYEAVMRNPNKFRGRV